MRFVIVFFYHCSALCGINVGKVKAISYQLHYAYTLPPFHPLSSFFLLLFSCFLQPNSKYSSWLATPSRLWLLEASALPWHSLPTKNRLWLKRNSSKRSKHPPTRCPNPCNNNPSRSSTRGATKRLIYTPRCRWWAVTVIRDCQRQIHWWWCWGPVIVRSILVRKCKCIDIVGWLLFLFWSIRYSRSELVRVHPSFHQFAQFAVVLSELFLRTWKRNACGNRSWHTGAHQVI